MLEKSLPAEYRLKMRIVAGRLDSCDKHIGHVSSLHDEARPRRHSSTLVCATASHAFSADRPLASEGRQTIQTAGHGKVL